jgi:hypothetical protein
VPGACVLLIDFLLSSAAIFPDSMFFATGHSERPKHIHVIKIEEEDGSINSRGDSLRIAVCVSYSVCEGTIY